MTKHTHLPASRGPLASTWGRARAAAAGKQGPASPDEDGRSPLPVAALGLSGPRSAPLRGAGEGRPLPRSLQPSIAAEASPPPGAGQSLTGASREGEERDASGFVKLAEIPQQLAAAGGSARGSEALASPRLFSPGPLFEGNPVGEGTTRRGMRFRARLSVPLLPFSPKPQVSNFHFLVLMPDSVSSASAWL